MVRVEETVTLHPRFRTWYRTSATELACKTRPVCESVSRGISEGLRLKTLVPAIFKKWPECRRYFRFDPRNPVESFRLKDSEVYSPRHLTAVSLIRSGGQLNLPELRIQGDLSVSDNAALLSLMASGRCTMRMLEDRLPSPILNEVRRLTKLGALVTARLSPRDGDAFSRPGIYRLQHSSLLFRTRQSGVLIDPHFRSWYQGPGIRTSIMPEQLYGKFDAVLISHYHEDHFDLPSLLMLPRDTPIIVPKIGRASILSWDLDRDLRRQGFRNIVVRDWWSEPLQLGDIRVHALPFYGEQATRGEMPAFPGIWNEGNTYLMEMDGHRTWLLIDSGHDARGSMLDVAREVHAKFGPMDLVLGNLRRFYPANWEYINYGSNWLTLSGEQIEQFPSYYQDFLTLGPDGSAEVCKAVRAREFRPFAHWWHSAGAPPDVEEALHLKILRTELKKRGCSTRVSEWSVGARYDLQRRR